MALKERTCINEILLRLTADGKIQGAHVREESQIYDDKTGVVRQATLGDPQPLVIAENGGIDLNALLGDGSGTVLLQVESLTNDLDAARLQLATEQQNGLARAGQLDALTAQLVAEQANFQQFQATNINELTSSQAHVAALQEALKQLRLVVDAAGVTLSPELAALTALPDAVASEVAPSDGA